MRKADRITSMVFILIGLAFWLQTENLQFSGYIFPRFLAFFLILLSAILFGQTFRKTRPSQNRNGSKDDVRYILVAIPIVLAWIILLDVLGFVVSGVIFLSVLTMLLDLERPPRFNRVISVITVYTAVVLGFWFAFHKLLLVPLPPGYLI
jgi:putative tricarboxylic transport membrane protein